MSQPKKPTASGQSTGTPPENGEGKTPGWAKGLRQLYDSVVEEPLPDSFEDLLKKLDRSDDD